MPVSGSRKLPRRRDGCGGENREVIVYVRVRQPGQRGRSRRARREKERERRFESFWGMGKNKNIKGEGLREMKEVNP